MKRKKEQYASALKYNSIEDNAPKIIAQGQGLIAEKIEEEAKKNSIPIYKDAKLAEQLKLLSIGEEIPSELYDVVAEVLAFIAKLDRDYSL